MQNRLIKQLERGRSMVEMLGVLMIIGVLSLIGIWTYDYASKYYESNKIQDVIARSKALADVNQSSTHIYEVERFLRENAPKYAPEVQQEEVRNAGNDNSKMTYTVTLKQVQENVCKMEFNNDSSFESMGVTIVSPTSAEGCSGYTDMVFAFDTLRTDIVCESDSDCGGTNNPFCKKGQCVPCEPSDCSGTTPICDKITGACEPCESDSECGPNKCAENGSCGECSSNEHCTDEFKPICDTYEGVCNACATDGECEPKYCALKGKCGDCSAHEHCPSSTPKCEFEYGVCEACPTATPVWNASDGKCITCYASNNGTPVWNGTKCISCYVSNNATPVWNGSACTTCPSSAPIWSTTKSVCEACPSNRPQYNSSTQTCGCPDGGSVVNDVCTIVLRNDGGFNACPWGPAPGCIPVVSKFGPYQYNYKVYVDGYVDDYLKFYVNSTNMPTSSHYNSWCDWINGTVVKSVGYDHYWNNELMGTLKAGNHGGLLAYSSSGCCYWKSPGKVWLELAP